MQIYIVSSYFKNYPSYAELISNSVFSPCCFFFLGNCKVYLRLCLFVELLITIQYDLHKYVDVYELRHT